MSFEELAARPAFEPAERQEHDAPYEAIEALNWSTIKHLAISPRMLRWRSEHRQSDAPPLRLGRAIHCASLEPERWPHAFVARPCFGDLRTKAAKAARDEWLARISTDVEQLDVQEHALAERCAEAVRSHPAAAHLLRAGRVEEIVTWTDEETGIWCKARVDFISPTYVLDLKSSRHDTLHALRREFATRLYHGQLSFYHDGAIAARLIPPDADGPYAIVVQTIEPYDVVPVRLTSVDLERGRGLYRSLLRRYLECQAADMWPGLAPDLIDLNLPAWTPSGENETEEW